MKHLLGIGKGIGIGVGKGMGTGIGKSRRVRLNDFIDYIQQNYRMHLNGKDYEFLQEITENYFADEIMKAIDYCKKRKSDSLIYLRDALSHKYYEEQGSDKVEPSWLNQEIQALNEDLTKEDKNYFKEFYKKYCSSNEEYQEKIKKYELE